MCIALSQVTARGSTITDRDQTPENRMETSRVRFEIKAQISANSRKGNAHTFLGFWRANSWTLTWTWSDSRQWALQWDAAWQTEARDSKQTQRTTATSCDVLCFPLKASAYATLDHVC